MDSGTDHVETGQFIRELKKTWFGEEAAEPEDEEFRTLEIEKITPSPYLNELIAAGKGVAFGQVGPRVLKKKVQEMSRRFYSAYKGFLEACATADLPEPVLAEAEKAVGEFEKHEVALREIEQYFEDGDTEHIRRGLWIAVSATNGLMRSYLAFNQMHLQRGGKKCGNCGYLCAPRVKTCPGCKSEVT